MGPPGTRGAQEDEAAAAESLGLAKFWGVPDRHVLERRWSQPSLDLHGMVGGYQGEGGKTVIPRTALAKLSMRLVPDMTVPVGKDPI